MPHMQAEDEAGREIHFSTCNQQICKNRWCVCTGNHSWCNFCFGVNFCYYLSRAALAKPFIFSMLSYAWDKTSRGWMLLSVKVNHHFSYSETVAVF